MIRAMLPPQGSSHASRHADRRSGRRLRNERRCRDSSTGPTSDVESPDLTSSVGQRRPAPVRAVGRESEGRVRESAGHRGRQRYVERVKQHPHDARSDCRDAVPGVVWHLDAEWLDRLVQGQLRRIDEGSHRLSDRHSRAVWRFPNILPITTRNAGTLRAFTLQFPDYLGE